MTYHVMLAICLVMAGAGHAHGEPPRSEDLAAADALFVEGKRLSEEQQFAEACARFQASIALSLRLGVALNLADCYEHLGRTASAWVAFGEAAALARRLGDDREGFALGRQDALVPRLCRLRILIEGAAGQDLAVVRDGVRVEPAAYGIAVPVDPGAHAVSATAPDRIPWATTVSVSGEGELATIVVPALAARPRPSMQAAREPPGRRLVTPATWVAAGAGVAAIGAGTILAIAASSLWQDARRSCDPAGNCTDAAYGATQRSHRDANLATAAFALGGAALVTSIVLYRRAPRARDPAPRIAAQITAGTVAAIVWGVW